VLRDFFEFLFALWQEWKTLLTGGTIIALAWLFEAIKGKPVPGRVNWLIIGVTLILSAFLSWRREWIQNGKGFITASVEEITTSVRDVTDVYANIKKRPYLHKWIRVTGKIDEVSPLNYPLPYPSVYIVIKCEGLRITFMPPRWRASHFLPLSRGTIVTVAGRISEIESYGLKLTGVELMSVGT